MTDWFRMVLRPKNLFLASFLLCGGLLVGAVIIEYTVKLVPCPLCVAQRVCFGLVGLSALLGSFGWLSRLGAWVASSLMLLFSLLGGGIALRQVWIQHFPVAGFDPTNCVVSFGSFGDAFLRALGGTGSCAVRDFTVMGLALPEWALLCFLFLMGGAVYLLVTLASRGQEDA